MAKRLSESAVVTVASKLKPQALPKFQTFIVLMLLTAANGCSATPIAGEEGNTADDLNVATTTSAADQAASPSTTSAEEQSPAAVINERFGALIAAFPTDGSIDGEFRGDCPLLRGVPPSVAKGTTSDDPLNWGLELGESDDFGTYAVIWCIPEGSSHSVITLLYSATGKLSAFTNGWSYQDEASPVPHSDPLGSSLDGKCYSDECHFLLENGVVAARFTTDQSPGPLLDWLKGDWISEVVEALSDEQIWLYTQNADFSVNSSEADDDWDSAAEDADEIVESCEGRYTYDNELPISVCSEGESVALFQEALGLEADGYFGPGTQNALTMIQDRAGLPVTRRIDATTWAHLGVTTNAPYPDLNGDGVVDASEFPG